MEQVLKTLIVDDSRSQCEVLRAHLLHFGVSVADYCHDGHAALEKLQAQQSKSEREYDAIFIDLHMEGMDGLELMHQLHEQHYRGGIIIISALNTRIVEYTVELVSKYRLRLLGSIEKPIERSLVAFMVRRIKSIQQPPVNYDQLPKRKEVISALESGELQVYFQPVIDSNTNDIYALECLSRLPIRGQPSTSPTSFLRVVEKFNLFEQFTASLVDKAAAGYSRIRDELGLTGKLNLNISPSQLFYDDLPLLLTQQLHQHALPIHEVCLEITENYSLTDAKQQKNLSRLRINGFQLALDDYGTGFTNLHQITNLPFTDIKLDAELINGMHLDKVQKIIVESVFRITDELNLNLVAEGVANPHDLIMLDDIGIHLYQGYFYARPKPEQEFIRWYQHWRRAVAESKAKDEKVIESAKKNSVVDTPRLARQPNTLF